MDFLQANLMAVLDPVVLLCILAGSLVGLFIGAVPGLGAMVAVTLFLPVSFLLPPLPAILLLLAVYQASEYGGCISSIVIGVPGTDSSVASLMDGYPMAQSGKPGKALGYSLYASTFGAVVGSLALLFFAAPMASFALRMSYPEYFLVGLLGVISVAVISGEEFSKGIIAGCLGLMVGTVGMDLITGSPRFTAGSMELYSGFTLVAVIVGMFAFSELMSMVQGGPNKRADLKDLVLSTSLSFQEWKSTLKASVAGSAIGSIVGIFPGTGAGTASWLGYSAAKGLSKTPKRFGRGAPEGIAGPESACNAAVGGAIVPLLALGIPGSGVIAVVMGAFIIHGIIPGPHIFNRNPDLTYGLLVGFLFTSVTMFLCGKLLTPVFARVLKIPLYYLISVVLIVALIGIYISGRSFFDIGVAITIGSIAFFLKEFNFPLPAFVIAFILSGILEENFRRALLISGGSPMIFIQRPFSLALVIFIVVVITVMLHLTRRQQSKNKDKVA